MKIKIIEIRKPGTKEERVFMKVMQSVTYQILLFMTRHLTMKGNRPILCHTCIGCLLCKPKRVCLSL